MNDLQIFNHTQFGKIRTMMIDGEPWFIGKDVAEALGYSNSRKTIADHVDDEDKTDGVTIRDAIGRDQNPVFINESGLYSLILSSKLPGAKQFKHWVTHDILPPLRKNGTVSIQTGYLTRDERITTELKVLESAARTLNMNDASKLLMYEKFSKQEGLVGSFLPKYEDNGGRQLISATTLLKKLNLDLSTVKFNQKMVEHGFLEERERSAFNGGDKRVKRFKALTAKGLAYGENQISPHNPREVQPLYYEDTFLELYKLVTQ